MKTKLKAKLAKSKPYREAFVASQINIGIPFQIRALREQRGWGQKELAERAGMMQPRISAMEKPGHGRLNLETLKRLASAFDVALLVKFVPFNELINWANDFSPETFHVASFDNEQGSVGVSAAVIEAHAPYLVVDNTRLQSFDNVSRIPTNPVSSAHTHQQSIAGNQTPIFRGLAV